MKKRPITTKMAAKGNAWRSAVPYDSDEDTSDEYEPLPPRTHPKTRAGARQRLEHEQEKRNTDVEIDVIRRGRQKQHYNQQQNNYQTINEEYSGTGSEFHNYRNYTMRQSWMPNQWKDTVDDDWTSECKDNEGKQTFQVLTFHVLILLTVGLLLVQLLV
ncbi:hypothetical protein DNTS_035189 [Danionella cerebrum]|uniref:Uncharacterized protein n=1 Tax=Danionella cerebrum TaxID=2873325 RepID=A0A553MW74_9TELE|nr:hypothetical protein DNTS_035189 [Danionella translucida]